MNQQPNIYKNKKPVLVFLLPEMCIRDRCWHALDFLPYTDGGILSFQDKLIKPMPEIYRLILDRYRLEPDECVFMDDTRANVEGAKAAGIHAFVFENIAQAKEELEKLGVK